jgi:hypothetical protein
MDMRRDEIGIARATSNDLGAQAADRIKVAGRLPFHMSRVSQNHVTVTVAFM